MDTQTYITLLTAFGGIILGFFLGQLGDYFRTIREDKRILKQVWGELRRADVEPVVPSLIEKFQQALLKRGIPQDQVNAMFNVPLTPLIALLKEMKLATPERMKERYQGSVNQLAQIDPLLAYKLSGQPQTDFNETEDRIGDTVLWVLPNPSGLNANYQPAALARLFRELRQSV